MKDGAPFKKWVAEIDEFVSSQKTDEFAAEFAMLGNAMTAFKNIAAMNDEWTKNDKQMKQLFATRTLHSAARVYCGKLLLSQAQLASKKLAELGEDHYDAPYYKGKIASAKFYVMNHVTDVFGFEQAMKSGDRSAIDIPEESLL
jgi:hypothetical protein